MIWCGSSPPEQSLLERPYRQTRSRSSTTHFGIFTVIGLDLGLAMVVEQDGAMTLAFFVEWLAFFVEWLALGAKGDLA